MAVNKDMSESLGYCSGDFWVPETSGKEWRQELVRFLNDDEVFYHVIRWSMGDGDDEDSNNLPESVKTLCNRSIHGVRIQISGTWEEICPVCFEKARSLGILRSNEIY